MNLLECIRNWAREKQKHSFKAHEIPCLSQSRSFLAKHAQGNGKYKEYFKRVERGVYQLLNE